MSYDIQLFRKEVKTKQLKSDDEDFFENAENIKPFSKKQKEYLQESLEEYGYFVESEDEDGIHFGNEEDDTISALLSKGCLAFSATSEDGISEIKMTSSELIDDGEFAKYDPQEDGWEDDWD